MTDETLAEERRLFEAWCTQKWKSPLLSRNMPDGSYNHPTMHEGWQAWQARALLAQSQTTEALALQMLVAAGHVTQAKVDEALQLARPLATPPEDKGSQDQ